MSLTHIRLIGENQLGYQFKIGLLHRQWIAYADSKHGAFLFPEVATGHHLGVADPATAIGLLISKANDSESGYGGIEIWHIPESERVAIPLQTADDHDDYF